ncbi:Alpha/Beta hydrolase protein [Circinella umbellata]|nr:Alpha/Beta hydrolase protein [Circinella umbellata]
MAPNNTRIVLDPIFVNYVNSPEFTPLTTIGNTLDIKNRMKLMREVVEKPYIGQKLPEIIEEDKTVVHGGYELRLSLFRPIGTENENLPAVIFYHGGGWVFGSKITYGKTMRDIVIKNHVVVVYIDYTLSPEVKFPTINEECYATLTWLLENGSNNNIDISKIATCGDSAGGQLATAIPLMAKKRGLGNNVVKSQILVYPATTEAHNDFKSYQAFSTGEYGLTSADCDLLNPLHFDDDEERKTDAKNNIFAYPLCATLAELEELPPALVLTAEADIIRDEGEAYARKLIRAGVPVTAVRILGSIHGYFNLPVANESQAYKQTMAIISQHLNEAFGKQQK